MGQRSDAAAEVVEGEGDPLLAQPAHEGRDGADVRARGLLRKFKAEGARARCGSCAPASSSIRQNSPSASDAADRFSENFAGCSRSRLRQAARRSIACSMTHRSMPRARSWHAAAPTSFSRPSRVPSAARMRSSISKRGIGRRRAQGQNGLRQQFEGIGGERGADLRGEARGRAVAAAVLLIAIEHLDPVAAALLGGSAGELGGSHRMVQAPVAVAEARDADAQGDEQGLVAARAAQADGRAAQLLGDPGGRLDAEARQKHAESVPAEPRDQSALANPPGQQVARCPE